MQHLIFNLTHLSVLLISYVVFATQQKANVKVIQENQFWQPPTVEKLCDNLKNTHEKSDFMKLFNDSMGLISWNSAKNDNCKYAKTSQSCFSEIGFKEIQSIPELGDIKPGAILILDSSKDKACPKKYAHQKYGNVAVVCEDHKILIGIDFKENDSEKLQSDGFQHCISSIMIHPKYTAEEIGSINTPLTF